MTTNLDQTRTAARRATWCAGAFCTWLAAVGALVQPALGQDSFVDAVTTVTQGTNGGAGAGLMPGIVLGPPRGAGLVQGGLDVFSLGSAGSIVLRFDLPLACDGPGADFTVFENAFHSGSPSGPLFEELGFVAVSQDGVTFVQFPHDVGTHAGLAGRQPVLSHPDNGIDPLDPAVSGGDSFDLADVGLTWAAYVRITDVGGAIPDIGDLPQFAVAPGAGFDLDAVAALHACDPGTASSPTPTATSLPPTATPTATTPASTPTPTFGPPPAAHDAAVSGRRPLRIKIRDGQSSATKRVRVKVRNADAAGDLPIHLTATHCSAITAVSVDFDRRLAGAQDSASIRAGRARAAILSVTVDAAGIATPDRQIPAVCVLTVTAAAQVPGNVDPTPADNSATIELRLLDANDF